MHGPDDLEDGFVIDHDLVAHSDGDDSEAVLLSDQEISEKRVDESEKKRKRGVKEREHKSKRRKLVEVAGCVPRSIADQTPAELSAYLSSLQSRTMSEWSSLELEDLQIPEYAIVDTRTWAGARTLDSLPEFIATVSPELHTRLRQRPKNSGSPTLLFVAGAALRVADVTRVLKDKQLKGDKGGDVAKLFAKHFKLAQHIAYLQRNKIGAAVGTPGRIGKLLQDTGALSVSALSHIILDTTHTDAKKRGLFDIPEIMAEIFRSVLAAPNILRGIKERKIKLVLF